MILYGNRGGAFRWFVFVVMASVYWVCEASVEHFRENFQLEAIRSLYDHCSSNTLSTDAHLSKDHMWRIITDLLSELLYLRAGESLVDKLPTDTKDLLFYGGEYSRRKVFRKLIEIKIRIADTWLDYDGRVCSVDGENYIAAATARSQEATNRLREFETRYAAITVFLDRWIDEEFSSNCRGFASPHDDASVAAVLIPVLERTLDLSNPMDDTFYVEFNAAAMMNENANSHLSCAGVSSDIVGKLRSILATRLKYEKTDHGYSVEWNSRLITSKRRDILRARMRINHYPDYFHRAQELLFVLRDQTTDYSRDN